MKAVVKTFRGDKITSTISNEVVTELELSLGSEVTVIVKATSVLVMA